MGKVICLIGIIDGTEIKSKSARFRVPVTYFVSYLLLLLDRHGYRKRRIIPTAGEIVTDRIQILDIAMKTPYLRRRK
jgi:hypothetical protein